MIIEEIKFQFNNGWAHIIYENDVVTVTDDQGLLLKFSYPFNEKLNINEIRSLLILNAGVRISKIDAIRMIHKDLMKNLNVLEYKMAPL